LISLNIFFGIALHISFVYLALAFIFIDFLKHFSFNAKDIKIVYYIAAISVMFQLFTFALIGDESRTALGTDPNFSGLIIFLLMIVGTRLNSKSVYVLFLLGLLLTASRMFLLMGALLILTKLLLQLKNFNKFLKFLHKKPLVMFFLINGISIFFISIFVGSYQLSTLSNYDSSFSRLFSFNDFSNHGRFTTTLFWFSLILENDFFWTNTLNVEVSESMRTIELVPHHSAIYSVVSRSYFYLIMVIIFFATLAENFKYSYLSAFLYIYFLGSVFLHGFYSPIFLTTLSLVLGIKISAENEK
tara:strand:- start:1238 stop:2140 length:903 start_codon:yes stop_codon:yes gene_type:complete